MPAKHLALALCVTAVAGCKPVDLPDLGPFITEGPTGPQGPCQGTLRLHDGNNQTGAVGSVLPQRLRVLPNWTGQLGCAPLFNELIEWSVETGRGTIAPGPLPKSVPDDYLYTATWTLGPTPGPQSVRATWKITFPGTPPFVIFEATAVNPH